MWQDEEGGALLPATYTPRRRLSDGSREVV